MQWITQQWTLGLVTFPGWGWALIVAALGAAAGLAVWAIGTARYRRQAADHEMTQAFLREMRLHHAEPEASSHDGAAGPDDHYSAAPAIDQAGAQGELGAVDGWESALERITRAEDALVTASDPAAFYDWLAADWAAYEQDVADIDYVLSTGVWATPTWLPQRALAVAQ